jgi:hypothetical protein
MDLPICTGSHQVGLQYSRSTEFRKSSSDLDRIEGAFSAVRGIPKERVEWD